MITLTGQVGIAAVLVVIADLGLGLYAWRLAFGHRTAAGQRTARYAEARRNWRSHGLLALVAVTALGAGLAWRDDPLTLAAAVFVVGMALLRVLLLRAGHSRQ